MQFFRHLGLPIASSFALWCLLGSSLSSADSETVTIDPPAESSFVCYAYGQKLHPPFVFTGVGTEQILLNGHEFYPRRPARDQLAIDNPAKATSAAHALLQLQDSLVDQAWRVCAKFEDNDAGMAAAVAYLRDQPEVKSVEITPGSLRIEWTEGSSWDALRPDVEVLSSKAQSFSLVLVTITVLHEVAPTI